jgi:AraC family transcriptional regulator of adaptative response/methylated-DNA-[protein]-cysteine methyltransferase
MREEQNPNMRMISFPLNMIGAKARWQNVLDRRPADFLYGVMSTGIFCRTTCPSRRPRPENVRFFDTAAEARAAGLRPCLRCRPEDAAQDLTALPSQVLERACETLRRNRERNVPLKELAAQAGLSPFHFQRTFRAALGVTPRQYAHHLRMKSFQQKLETASNVTEAIYDAGFQSSSRLYESSTRELGMTPTDLRRKAANLEIRYATAACPLGRILVASTTKGICAITLGDADAELIADLQARFTRAHLTHATQDELQQALDAAITLIEEPAAAFNLPLDLRATAFQLRVWQALQKIPRGETRSYAAVAASLGQPTATRAVARACASNPVALAVPCHRVVGSSGALTGYRWGVERKRKLLELEARG